MTDELKYHFVDFTQSNKISVKNGETILVQKTRNMFNICFIDKKTLDLKRKELTPKDNEELIHELESFYQHSSGIDRSNWEDESEDDAALEDMISERLKRIGIWSHDTI
ncbi:MAG: hypothetical protein WCF65_05075 [Parachlamydiaceae bacterium]